MFTRIALLLAVVATLCGAAFTLGSTVSGGRQDQSVIPPEHPLAIALSHAHDLALTDEQLQKLRALRDAMGKEFSPLRAEADTLQNRLQELPQSGKPDPAAAAKLQQEGDALGAKIQAMAERYAQEVGKLLTEEQVQKLTKFSNSTNRPSEHQDFVLDVILHSRDALDITPQQFTKLQYLQADLLRAFAPLREKMELLQIEIRDKFAKFGKEPTSDYRERAEEIQKQVAALQSQISEKAVKDVLEPKQRAKLEELLRGEHRPTPNER